MTTNGRNLSRLPFDGPADQPADALPFDDQPEPTRHDAPLSRGCEACGADRHEPCRQWCTGLAAQLDALRDES